MKKKHGKYATTVLLILLGLFLWYEVRPAKIRENCSFDTVFLYKKDEISMTYEEFYDFYYHKCLNQEGLKK